MKKMILILFSILLISGCAGVPDIFGNIFGTQKNKVNELPPDVIVVQNINTLPTPPINTGDQFSVSFELNNQEEQREADYVGYKLLDSGLCELYSGDSVDYMYESFVPAQTEFIEWTFKTPNASDIAYLSTKCPVRFRTNYTFEAISTIDFDVISQQKYDQLQQSGGPRTFTPTITLGRGPIKIYIEFGATLPIKSGSVLPIYITVEDKGIGLFSQIPEGDLTLKIPWSWVSPEINEYPDCGERISCTEMDPTLEYYVCTNNVNITMIKRKSPKFRCSMKVPGVDIEKIFNVEAYLKYNYEITKEVEVEVKPLRT